MTRVGIGYDVHRVAQGRRLVLCGVEFPGEIGLDGHSDADVALHAVADALLGAAALGDIGEHFPPADERWRDVDSGDLLTRIVAIIAPDYNIGNVDLTLVGERPRVAPRREAMRQRLAELLGIDIERVSVKATTNERLGAIGRGEGIAALASALLEERR
ncbi:MAG TPA: 2-C-methyl-D-erythritol 2,4-cyclodiphosphate synthase [Thermomicrobiales bacterium]|nr:2-C-methyl-D-erythritol 2,4-cyclodiphosphate synthase [Thermomicrobiales bacterium]